MTPAWSNGSKHENGKLAFLHQKEIVLNKDDTANFLAAIEATRDLFSKDFEKQKNIVSGISGSNITANNNVTMNIELPNVQNYDDFVNQLQRDKRFENIVQAMTIDNALGKNSLNKYKFK